MYLIITKKNNEKKICEFDNIEWLKDYLSQYPVESNITFEIIFN